MFINKKIFEKKKFKTIKCSQPKKTFYYLSLIIDIQKSLCVQIADIKDF